MMLGMYQAVWRACQKASVVQMELGGPPLLAIVMTHEQWAALVNDLPEPYLVQHTDNCWTFMGLEVVKAAVGWDMKAVGPNPVTALDLRTPGDWKRPALQAKTIFKAALGGVSYVTNSANSYYTYVAGTTTATTGTFSHYSIVA